jgi:hypothetical protein
MSQYTIWLLIDYIYIRYLDIVVKRSIICVVLYVMLSYSILSLYKFYTLYKI